MIPFLSLPFLFSQISIVPPLLFGLYNILLVIHIPYKILDNKKITLVCFNIFWKSFILHKSTSDFQDFLFLSYSIHGKHVHSKKALNNKYHDAAVLVSGSRSRALGSNSTTVMDACDYLKGIA